MLHVVPEGCNDLGSILGLADSVGLEYINALDVLKLIKNPRGGGLWGEIRFVTRPTGYQRLVSV